MTRRAILNEPEKWVIVPREPTAWVPSYALSILHQEGHHVAVPTALHKKQLKSGNGTALYARPDPDALADLVAYVSGLEKSDSIWKQNSADTYAALSAMRNEINEHVPMPSMESDLLKGPESGAFCAAVAHAVITRVAELEARLTKSLWRSAYPNIVGQS